MTLCSECGQFYENADEIGRLQTELDDMIDVQFALLAEIDRRDNEIERLQAALRHE